jgi:type IV pilus assembly protein PilY1
MKKMQGFLLVLAVLLMGFSASLRAEDTDIYVDNSTNDGVPNILFVMENGANADAAISPGCAAYSGTAIAPSMGTAKAYGILQCALVDAINSLPDSGVVNIGIMATNANGFASDVTSPTDDGYHEICSTSAGGCLIRKLTVMNAANKASLVKFIKSWHSQGTPNSPASFGIKVNSSAPGTTMQEAWAYLSGKVGMSGTSYGTSLLSSGCQKNFVIYIGNTDKNPSNESPSPYDGTNALTSSQVGATAAQLVPIAGTVKFNPAVCGATTSAIADNWADEWARYMYQKDAGTATQQGLQNITTYTIGVNSSACTASTAALFSSMAANGGGKYFSTANAAEVTAALEAVLNEVQAVNSVFSSASLPVSVNAEGSYLNQIYLGMFRPDGTGAPRWLGNLKQYQLIKNTSGNLVLGDSLGNAAISSAGTGFISPNAVSFWSKKDTTKLPDSTGGFYLNDLKGVPPSPFDSPDGEVVEKGGVAQQLRLEGLTANFGSTEGSSTNPRRLYTYCPSGSSCNSSLTDSSNAFSTANSGMASTAFGTTSSVKISSVVRTGTTALVTTTGNHGFATGASVTISNVTPTDYNVTQAVTVNSATTFTITGLPDYPTTPSAGTYTVSALSASPVSVLSITRTASASGSSNSETATVTTSSAHGFTSLSNVSVTGATDSAYNYSGLPAAVPTTTTFTFPVTISPPATTSNTYQATVSPTTYPAKTLTALAKSGGTVNGTTSSVHGFWVGESVQVAGAGGFTGIYAITAVGSSTTFTANPGFAIGNPGSFTSGTIAPDATPKTVTLTRTGTTATVNATASAAPANFFGNATGGTRVVNIAQASGTATNESAYVKSNVTVTCTNATCTSFTYPIATSPLTTAGGTMSASLTPVTVSIAAGNITRSTSTTATATATVTGVTAGAFTNGQTVNIAASGTALTSETAYLGTGTWTISCTSPCTSFTYGPITRTPTPTGSGSSMQAYSGSTPPDKNTIIRWVRGEDNYGDEKGPGGTVTVRPSIHGDVLHSRPLVINYGDSRGILVFYGSNDGVYHAVNGNQTAALGAVPAGDELWGLVLQEHYGGINRLRLNSPELKFPSTLLATAQPKDYFVDGPTGAYQKLKADGTIDKAYIFMTMRRGGRFIYALDVSTPTSPVVLWRIDPSTSGFSELGQSWSRPRLTLLQGGGSSVSTTPVLVFGAGYDPAEDSEPPGTDSMGRGIYVVNAATGALIWSASSSCTTSATCLNVPGMNYAIPSDIAFVDRDLNGLTDKMYFGDVGGNIWRADVSDPNTSNWTVTKLAALGCATGTCAAGTTPRKFFFPPSVLTVKPAGQTGSYDLVSLASGDREHPLKNTATGSSYNVNDDFFTILDTGTAVGTPVTSNVTLTNLFNATTTPYDGTLKGFYLNFTTGEKAVNAPLAVNGSIFFATNRPVAASQTCSANLGEAKAYAVSPFLGTTSTNILPGGGLAPSAVSGLITIQTTNADGSTSSSEQKFCIGCGISVNADGTKGTCNSALENCNAITTIPKNMKRTYWYRK